MKKATGAELALHAADLAETDLDEIRTLLRVRVIPHIIDSIWTYGESVGASRLRSKPLLTSAIEELSRIVVTFPPSTALTSMHQILDHQNVPPQIAAEFLKEFARLSRSPLSTLNYFRHIKTSINVHLRALCIGWDEEKMGSDYSLVALREIKSRVNPFVILDKDLSLEMTEQAEALGAQEIKEVLDLDNWLDEMALFLSQAMIEDRKSRPSFAERYEEAGKKNQIGLPTHTLTLYSGRFTHYVYRAASQSLGVKQSSRYKTSWDLQNKSKFELLESIINKSPKDTYEYLTTIVAHRPNRMHQASSNFESSTQKDHIQKFDLSGRELRIESKGSGYERELVEKLLSNLQVQFDLKLYGDSLIGVVENKDGSLKLSLNKPNKADFDYIQKILKALGNQS